MSVIAIVAWTLAGLGVVLVPAGLMNAKETTRNGTLSPWPERVMKFGALCLAGATLIGITISEVNQSRSAPASSHYSDPNQDPPADNGCPAGLRSC